MAGAFVFRGGYHPRKTSCKSTVGANRLAGPIMSWTDHYQWQSYLYLAKNENVRSGVLRLPQAQCKRTFTIGPNTCQLATVTVGRPSRVNVQETNNSLCRSCWSSSHYTAKTSVLNSTPPVLWEVHTKLVLILTPVGVSLIPLGVKFNTWWVL